MAGEADLGSARGKIVVASDLRGVEQSARALAGFEKQTQTTDQALNKLTQTAAGLGLALAGAVALSARSFIGFETQMLGVKAVAGATEEEFQKLNDLAIKLGQDTVFSAKEAAGALEELSKAGVSVEDILNGAADGAVALAGAAGIGIPEAAALIASALNQFELAGSEAAAVADIFANAANKSATDATSLGEAFKYVATRAHGLKIPMTEVAAAVSAMADAGIDGSSAGTALNAMLGNLVAPTKEQALLFKQMGLEVKDAEGNFIGITSVLEQLVEKTKGLGDVQKQELLTQLFDERGARAANVLLNTMTEQAVEGEKAWVDYVDAMGETGSAAENMKIRMSGVQGAIEQLKGSVETAQIEFGEALAPAIMASAKALTGLVNAFSGLPDGMKATIAATAALSSGLLLLGVGAIKAVQFAKGLKGAMDAVSLAMGKGNLSARQFAGGLGVAVIAIGAVIAIEKTRQEIDAIGEAFDHLGDQIESIFALKEEFKLQGLVESAAQAQFLAEQLQWVGFIMQKMRQEAREETTFDFGGDIIPNLHAVGDILPFISGAQEDVAKSTEIVNAEFAKLAEVLADPRIDGKKFTDATNAVVQAFLDSKGTADDVKILVDGLDAIIAKKSEYAKTTEDATAATEAEAEAEAKSVEELAAATKAQEEADAQAEKFSRSVAEIAEQSLIAQGAIRDMSPALEGVQEGFAAAGSTIEETVIAMDKFGDIRLTQSNREALELSNALADSERHLESIGQAIGNNQEDLGMWAGRLSLVTDVLGGNTEVLQTWLGWLQDGSVTQEEFNAAIASGVLGPLEKLDAAYASGAISLDTYNQAKAAALFLIQRSAGGIQDENVELINNVIQLAAYVKEHDDAAGAVDRLTDAQLGFLEATKSDVGKEFLTTLELFQSIGASPDAIKKFIVDSSQADPLIASLVKDLGLLEEPTDIDLTWSNSNAVLDDLGGAAEFLVSFDGKHVEVHVDTEAQALQVAEENADALDGKEVTFVIHADDGQYNKTIDELKVPEPVVVPVTTSPIADIPILGGLIPPDLEVPAPDPVPITAEDKTAEGVDAAKANIATVPESAQTAGTDTGLEYAAGLAGSSEAVTKAITDLGSAIYVGLGQIRDNVGVFGTNAGQNFAVAYINGIAGYNNLAWNQGFLLAWNSLQGAKNALGISSPSKEAWELAKNFGGTFNKTLIDQKDDAREAGKVLYDAVSEQMGGGIGKWSLLQGEGAAGRLGQFIADSKGQQGTQAGGTNVYATIDATGTTDPEKTADLVVTKLYNTVTRLDAAGALGR